MIGWPGVSPRLVTDGLYGPSFSSLLRTAWQHARRRLFVRANGNNVISPFPATLSMPFLHHLHSFSLLSSRYLIPVLGSMGNSPVSR